MLADYFGMYALWIHLNKDCVLGLSKFQDEIEAILARRAKMAAQGGATTNAAIEMPVMRSIKTTRILWFALSLIKRRRSGLESLSSRVQKPIQNPDMRLLGRQQLGFNQGAHIRWQLRILQRFFIILGAGSFSFL